MSSPVLTQCRHLSKTINGSSVSSLPTLITQKRHYAAPTKRTAPKQRSTFRPNKGSYVGGAQEGGERKRGARAFQPMSASQLQDPIFQSGRLDELTLPPFLPEALVPDAVGQAYSLPVAQNNARSVFGVPKNLLIDFRLLSKPCTVVRDVTLATIDKLDVASTKPSHHARVVFTGPLGCGKSVLLLQALEYCSAKDWVILYVPRAINLVNSTTPYIYDLRTQTYLQPAFAFQTLQRFYTVNLQKLRSLKTQTELAVDRKLTVPAGTSFAELANIGMKDKSLATTVLSTLLDQLSKQETYPVLLAVDDFQALYCKTAYRDPHFSPIKSYHLSMPRLLLDYASGIKSFARGAVFGALSMTNTTFSAPLELREALGIPETKPLSPLTRRSEELQTYARGIQGVPVPAGMSVDEAAALFEVWMKDKALHTAPDDNLFLSKYSETGGNARQFVWKGLLNTLQS